MMRDWNSRNDRPIYYRLMDAGEAAEYLGLTVATIRKMTYRRELPFLRPTGRRTVRYRLNDLAALVRMRSQPARTAGGGR